MLSTEPGTCYLPSTGKFNAEKMHWGSLTPRGPIGPSLGVPPSAHDSLVEIPPERPSHKLFPTCTEKQEGWAR